MDSLKIPLSASIYLLFWMFSLNSQAQKMEGQVRGAVVSEEGESLPGIVIYIKGTSIHTLTGKDGTYQLSVPAGKHEVSCSALGFVDETKWINVQPAKVTELNFTLTIDTKHLDEVTVLSKSAIEQVKESPYNVVALDAKSLHNSTMDLGHVLNRVSGVKIRESGGMGSNMSISLNGFTGRHIKLFMDGVPMQGFGSAFQLNNIPVSIADRIEVYKGVVPVEFGSDAIGGAINIVTNQNANTFVDASYSAGSFNTHRTNISGGHTTKSGLSFQLTTFLNYSDNNYKVHLGKMLDVSTGTYIPGDYWVRRFHNRCQNQTLMAKVGFVRKSWADRFFLGLTTGQVDEQIQNASTLEIVYGARSRTTSSLLPSLEYYKRNFLVQNLNFRLTGNYNYNSTHNVDTAARLYNWYGEYMLTRTRGESGTNTLSEFKNKNFSSTANLSYHISDHHSLTVNDVVSGYTRKISSSVLLDELTSAADTMRRVAQKNVMGISYMYRHNEKWNLNLFGKHYYQHVIGPVDTAAMSNNSSYEEQSRSFQTSGYGLAATHFIKNIQLKASIERAYRLPSESELFGDELLTTANSSLKAENSMNINFGFTLNKELKKDHVLYADINGYYRLTQDFIQRVQNARYGTIGSVNFGRVRNIGIDSEVRYYYKNKFMLGGMVTYMDLRNREKLRDSQSSISAATYNDRMPNIPYFYGNADAVYYFYDVLGKGNVLSFSYIFNFVDMFYLLWKSQGNKNTKATLPQQLYHDFSATYSIKNGTYNISLEILNFTDAMLYDNFSLQKPGRSFNTKLRYYFNNRH